MKLVRLLVVLMVVAFSMSHVALAAELDQAYVDSFGWGTILASGEGLPAKDHYSASQFVFRNGKFYLSKNQTLDMRGLLKNGETYGMHWNEIENADPNKFQDCVNYLLYTTFWVSHDSEGNPLVKNWRQTNNVLPSWDPIGEVQTKPADIFADFNTWGLLWSDIVDQIPEINDWLANAKPGYQIYVVHRTGYKRNAPEAAFWDKEQLRNVTPIDFIYGDILASSVIEIR